MSAGTTENNQLSQLLAQWESSGRRLEPEELCAQFPQMLGPLREAIANAKADAALHRFVAATQVEDSPATTPPSPDAIPSQIGQYRIVSILGHGGMGTVYRAEQDWPKRTIALKVLSQGLMTESMRQRFRWEADVLARLDHPGIAKIHEAGIATTSAGPQPFFAMELVDGVRLDEYIKQHNPPLKARLHLLIDICQAVHHAHTKGVIHRDLKPSNILVTSDAKPKVLDFGVARAIDSDIQTTTLHTESGQLVGTLPYMAPEQAAGKVNELDTSSDVYALGVIAYEVLSGRMPYMLAGKALHEVVRAICEEEPSRLSSVDRSLRGDVETIVQKALEKDKTRRYGTAGELAADVKRYLDYEPITARPPSALYNLRKFAKRNKLVVTAVCAIFASLLAASVISTVFAVRERRQRAEAERQKTEAATQADIATAVSQFLSERVLAGATPERLPDKNIRDAIVKAMLDPAAVSVADDFKDKPVTEAAVRNSLALAYESIGRADLGLPHAQVALAHRRRALGDDHWDTLASINHLGLLLQAQGKLNEAAPLYREAMDRSRRVLGEDHPDTLKAINNLGILLQSQGELDQCEPLIRESFDRSVRVLGKDHPDTLGSINNMASLLQAQGNLEEAERMFREALLRQRRALGEDHPDTLTSIVNMGHVLEMQGRLEEAEPLLREAMERCKRVLGEDHVLTLTAVNNMGYMLEAQGKPDEAEPLYRDALERRRRVLGDDHPNTLGSIGNMGALLQARGRVDLAEPLAREALERSRRVLGDDHPDTLFSTCSMGNLLQAQGKLDQAELLCREAAAKAKMTLTPSHPYWNQLGSSHAECLDALGRHDEAAAVRQEFGLPSPSTQPATMPATAPASRPAA